MLQRYTLLKRTSPLKRSRLRRVSQKRAEQLREYSKRRAIYLAKHPVCEVWCREHGWRWINDRTYEGGAGSGKLRIEDATTLFRLGAPRSDQVHHMNKRRGEMLLDEDHWLAVCPAAHERIEQNKAWARRVGFLLDF